MPAKKNVQRAARALFRLCLVDGVVNEERARQVAQRIVGSGRRDALPILADLHRLARLDRERHSALVESVAPLPDTLREKIRVDLARTYGAGLEASFRENPALIGGMRIKVASDVYDGSVRARLAALEADL